MKLSAPCLLLALSFVSAVRATPPEPDIKAALAWWPPQKNVWTPIGWKDHLFRFQVVYNGHLICSPAGKLLKPHTRKYVGRDFQLNVHASADGSLPPVPRDQIKLKLTDGGVGVQGWREGSETPVLWTDHPRQDGVVLRHEVFGHMTGGRDVARGDESLYAWVRLSVKHVDPIRAPKTYCFAVQLSGVYYDQTGGSDDSLYLFIRPEAAKLPTALTSRRIDGDQGRAAGLDVAQGDGLARLRVLPGGDGAVSLTEVAPGTGVYNLKVELPVREGAHTDVLVPMLVTPTQQLDEEAKLGFDGALVEAEAFWKAKPPTAARIHVPEKYVNDAIARNIQFAQIVAERNPENGEYSFISGSYGYDALWTTPTSMISHMFLDLLGYHAVVDRHVALFKANQGTVRPPGPAYKPHPGYFSSPKTLTTIDWLTDHGAVMEALSRHALLTGDEAFIDHWLEPLLKACDFLKDSCAATGHGGAEGVLPPGVATDTVVPTQAVWNDAWNYKGLTTTVKLLKRTNHPRAAELEAFAADYKRRFNEAFRARAAQEPKWNDPDGKQHPVLPTNLIPAPQRHLYDDCFLLDTGPLVLPWAGLMEANDPLMVSFADFFRVGPNRKLRGPQPSALDRAVLEHEISSCEPCYSWNIVNSWKTGDRARFLEGMYSLFAGAISTQTFINCEHRHAMYGNVFVAPLMTWCMRQSVIDDQLGEGELHLLRLVPMAWISPSEETVFEHMPTEYGPVDLRFKRSADGSTLDVTFAGRWRTRPGRVVLHAPPMPGLRNIVINGKSVEAKPTIELGGRKLMGLRTLCVVIVLAMGMILLGVQAAAAKEPIVVPLGEKGDGKAIFWLESSMKRVYNRSAPGSQELSLLSARNGKIAFQACFRNERTDTLTVDCKVLGADDLRPQVRYVGMVPMHHLTPNTKLSELEGIEHVPGLVPDPLWPMTRVWIGPYESRSFWITLNVPADAKPGPREFTVRMEMPNSKQVVELPVKLDVADLVIQPRKDFPVVHWWRGEATWDFYKTGMFEDPRWWDITRAQLENMLAHGSDVVYVPIFFNRRETFKRPCQLLIVDEPEPGRYTFDWSRVKQFTDMCKQIGFNEFEWSHLWIYWGVENPARVYRKQGDQFVMLWDPQISGFSDTFLNFLRQFLPELKAFLDREGILERSYFHLSDEPGEGQHVANYKRAREILRDLAPWMKVMDALSDIEYGKQGLTDMPIPIVSSAQAYIDAGIPHWVYYCCFPHGPWLNRFLDTPLPKVRMSGFLFYRLRAKGFLHWGFNYWHKMEREDIGDPFNDATNASYPGIPYGDPFMIYPGPDGKPIDSIRWEVFAESLQDYAILQSAEIKPDDPLLADVKTYAEFPKDEAWVRKTMEAILKRGDRYVPDSRGN